MPRRKEPHIPDAVLDQLLAGADPRIALEPNGLLDDLKKALAERVLNPEMAHHLAGGERGTRRQHRGDAIGLHVSPIGNADFARLDRDPVEPLATALLAHRETGEALGGQ